MFLRLSLAGSLARLRSKLHKSRSRSQSRSLPISHGVHQERRAVGADCLRTRCAISRRWHHGRCRWSLFQLLLQPRDLQARLPIRCARTPCRRFLSKCRALQSPLLEQGWICFWGVRDGSCRRRARGRHCQLVEPREAHQVSEKLFLLIQFIRVCSEFDIAFKIPHFKILAMMFVVIWLAVGMVRMKLWLWSLRSIRGR